MTATRPAKAHPITGPEPPQPDALPDIPTTEARLRDTHRLIPSRYSPAGTVLSRLAAGDDALLSGLMELDDATNDRFLGEDGLLSGIGIRELVFGVRYAHIVNAAFTHASPTGGRFNPPTRGAWYAATERPTALAEIAFHRRRQLEEVRWPDPETVTVDDYLADISATLHDLRTPPLTPSSLSSTTPPSRTRRSAAGGPTSLAAAHAATQPASPFARYLQPDPIPACYADPQALAARLLAQRADGLLYPSVRRPAGTCIACFRPALVYNVRRGARLELTLHAGRPFRPSQAREIPIPNA